mgnify:FL=1
MEFLVGLVVGFFLAFVVIRIIANAVRKMQSDDLDEKIKEGLTKLKEKIVPSRIERVNGMLYLYNKETEEFLGQGKDMQELNDVVKARFPDKLFNVAQAELDKYMRKSYEQ